MNVKKILSIFITTCITLSALSTSFATSNELGSTKGNSKSASVDIKKAITIQEDIANIKATQKIEYGDKKNTYEQLQKDFDTYFQGDEKKRIVEEFKKYVDSKLIKDGYNLKSVSTLIKAKYYEKCSLEFVQYAVQNDIIKINRTTQSYLENPLDKYALRAQFWIASKLLAAPGINLKYTAEALGNSLQDAPPTLVYDKPSPLTENPLSEYIKSTKAYKVEMDNFKKKLKLQKGGYLELPGNLVFEKNNSNTDMYLAFHKVQYRFWATRYVSSIGTTSWNINVRIFDTYNFEYWRYKEKNWSKELVRIINNYGALAQEKGAIVPYNVFIYTTDFLVY